MNKYFIFENNLKIINMRKIILTSVLVLSLGLFVTSCNETKKEVKKEVQETKEVVKDDNQEPSDEMAMATYQCPMKCEGEKTYDKPGTCPKCKMDLKEVETSHDADKDNKKKSDEENHDGNDHD